MLEGHEAKVPFLSLHFSQGATASMTYAYVDADHLAEIVFTGFLHHKLSQPLNSPEYSTHFRSWAVWCVLRVLSTSFIRKFLSWGLFFFPWIYYSLLESHHALSTHILTWTSALCFGKWSQAILFNCSSCSTLALGPFHGFWCLYDMSSSTECVSISESPSFMALLLVPMCHTYLPSSNSFWRVLILHSGEWC